MNKLGAWATFDAITFFMVALIISVVITTAVLRSREVSDLEEARMRIDEAAQTLSVVIQYSIRSCFFVDPAGNTTVLEHRTVLELLGLILLNKELDLGYDTEDIAQKIELELSGVLGSTYCLQAESRNNSTVIPVDSNEPDVIVSTSLCAPASEDLGGLVTLSLRTWT